MATDEAVWRKSSYSASTGNCVEVGWQKRSHSASGNCVEVGWRKSSHSANENCVEVAVSAKTLVRDSKNPAGPTLAFDHRAWRIFLTSGN